MNQDPSITSAALYFEPLPSLDVNMEFIVHICDFFSSLNLSVNDFGLSKKGFSPTDAYNFRDHHEHLASALEQGGLTTLELYCTLNKYAQLAFGWNGYAHLDACRGVFYLGIDSARIYDSAMVLQKALILFNGLVGSVYGISYQRHLFQGPFFYAVGLVAGLGYDKSSMKEANGIGLWRRELAGARRYLTGWFRGAYPSSVLRESHLRSIRSNSISPDFGSIFQLDKERWLWKLSESEIPSVQMALEEAGLVVNEDQSGSP